MGYYDNDTYTKVILPAPPPPPLHPGTREPIGPADLAPLFPMAIIEQEVSTESYIDIPKYRLL